MSGGGRQAGRHSSDLVKQPVNCRRHAFRRKHDLFQDVSLFVSADYRALRAPDVEPQQIAHFYSFMPVSVTPSMKNRCVKRKRMITGTVIMVAAAKSSGHSLPWLSTKA